MTLPDSAYTQLTENTTICRILNGLWQVSGTHGTIDETAAIAEMMSYHTAGLTTWDLADHYGPAEDFIGKFRRMLDEDGRKQMQAFTKWVPRPGIRINSQVVEDAVTTSMTRMGVDQLDMLQFHWWDYRDSGYLSALKTLVMLVMTGKIKHLGLTNFDTRHVKNLMDNGIRVVSNQVQFSIIDRRPEVAMIPYCQENGIKILAYGTLAGGLLTDQYLGRPEPTRDQLNTASLRKYKPMIDKWGGWELFQTLLQTLRHIADKHHVSIANVATRYIMDKPTVAGVIIGVRLGIQQHIADNVCTFDLVLDEDDLAKIHAVTSQANDLYQTIGDCGQEYR
ncbi:MAG: aldo/keto reductase [Chloroflexi bacterium]|nr:MAG: aldo/keto reductase [Chloroflexota bacterium]